MKVAIIGANGFIGIALRNALERSGVEVGSVTRDNCMRRQTPLDHEWTPSFSGSHAAVYLAVSSTPVKTDKSDAMAQVNLLNRSIDAASAAGLEKFVFLSSGGTVYGEPDYLPIDEQHRCSPKSAYGALMLKLEALVTAAGKSHAMRPIILRASNVYGRELPAKEGQGVVEHFAAAIAARSLYAYAVTAKTSEDFIYIDDMVSALSSALSYEGSPGIFNIGTGIGTSINDLADMMELQLGFKMERERLDSAAVDISANVLNPAKAKLQLGWKARVPIEDGLARYLPFFTQARS